MRDYSPWGVGAGGSGVLHGLVLGCAAPPRLWQSPQRDLRPILPTDRTYGSAVYLPENILLLKHDYGNNGYGISYVE